MAEIESTTSCFNPRPRVGGDWGSSTGIACVESFNPRPRVGGDQRPLRVFHSI